MGVFLLLFWQATYEHACFANFTPSTWRPHGQRFQCGCYSTRVSHTQDLRIIRLTAFLTWYRCVVGDRNLPVCCGWPSLHEHTDGSLSCTVGSSSLNDLGQMFQESRRTQAAERILLTRITRRRRLVLGVSMVECWAWKRKRCVRTCANLHKRMWFDQPLWQLGEWQFEYFSKCFCHVTTSECCSLFPVEDLPRNPQLHLHWAGTECSLRGISAVHKCSILACCKIIYLHKITSQRNLICTWWCWLKVWMR